METAAKRVVIVGGGFGGVRCARTLRRRLPVERVAPYILAGCCTFEEAREIFATHHADTIYVVEDRRIAGVITRTDLLRIVDLVAVRPVAERRSVSIRSDVARSPRHDDG